MMWEDVTAVLVEVTPTTYQYLLRVVKPADIVLRVRRLRDRDVDTS